MQDVGAIVSGFCILILLFMIVIVIVFLFYSRDYSTLASRRGLGPSEAD
jgi:hypothetical protein